MDRESATNLVTVELSDLSLPVRIRETALRLYAEFGTKRTSIRMVADAAGVSAGAVSHHYKSKEALSQAVQASVFDKLSHATRGVGLAMPPLEAVQARRIAYDQLLLENPHLSGYIRQITLEGGPAGAALWRASAESAHSEMEAMIAAGIARRLDDPEIGMILYRAITSVNIYFRPLIEETTGLDLSDPATVKRFRDAAIDILTKPVFADPA